MCCWRRTRRPAAKPEQPAEIKPYTLTDEEKAAGWQMVFDGKNNYALRGLTYNDFINRGWRIDRGSLFCVKEIKDMGLMTGGHLITTDQFTDFEFRFEWKLSVSGKSGIMYFAEGTREKPEGFIYSIMDDVHNPDGLKGGPIRRTGALYNIIPPIDGKKLNEADHWNEGRIIVEGNHVEQWLNDIKVVEYIARRAGVPEAARGQPGRRAARCGARSSRPRCSSWMKAKKWSSATCASARSARLTPSSRRSPRPEPAPCRMRTVGACDNGIMHRGQIDATMFILGVGCSTRRCGGTPRRD